MGIVPLGNLALLFSVFSLFPWEPVTSLFWFFFSAYSPRVLFPLGEPSDAYSLLGLYYHSLLLSSFPSLFSLCLVWVNLVRLLPGVLCVLCGCCLFVMRSWSVALRRSMIPFPAGCWFFFRVCLVMCVGDVYCWYFLCPVWGGALAPSPCVCSLSCVFALLISCFVPFSSFFSYGGRAVGRAKSLETGGVGAVLAIFEYAGVCALDCAGVCAGLDWKSRSRARVFAFDCWS